MIQIFMKKYNIVILLAFIWASYYYSLGTSNNLLSPFAVGFVIRLITGLLLFLFLLSKHSLKKIQRSKQDIPLLISIGLMGYLLDVTAFLGSRYGNSVVGTLLLKTDVIMVGIMSAVFYKEKFSTRQWLMVALMLVGEFMVLGVNTSEVSLEWADLLYVLSAFFVSCNVFLIRRAQKKRIDNEIIAFYNNGVTFLLFLVSLLVDGNFASTNIKQNIYPLTTALIVGSFGQFFVYIVYYNVLQRLPVRNVKILLLLIPVITMFYDFLFTQAVPTPGKLLGTAIVLVSAVLILKSNHSIKERNLSHGNASKK